MNRKVSPALSHLSAIVLVLLGGFAARAQTGDARTVTEPVIPAACTVILAQQATTTGFDPASETTFDTSSIQSALNSAVATCGTGTAVELSANGASNAFLIQPITLPTGVTLVVDGGVTVFGSRNPADYQVTGAETCGTVGTAGTGCNALITASAANAGIMGYGIIDGRGEDKLLVNGTASTSSWWDIASQAQNTSGGAQNNPILLSANAAGLTLYKITLRNSPMFHVKWSGNTTNKTGFTAWGVKVITPFTARNTDGIDPSGENITITNSSISDGDDMVAVSASSAAANITVQNTNTYSGHGISIGSYTKGGLTNMLVQNINEMGTAADGNGGGLKIKSSQDRGGTVSGVLYQNICIGNVKAPIYVSPFYNTNSGTLYPSYLGIVYRNIQVVTEGTITLQGYANTGATVTKPAGLTFDNLIVDTIKQSDLNPTPSYLNITLGPGPVTSLLASQTASTVTYTNNITNPTEAPYACSTANFQYLVGELFGSTTNGTNLKTVTTGAAGNVTLNAMLQPAMSQITYNSTSGGGSYTGTPAPTAQVQFMETTSGTPTSVGTATLGGNGTIASLALTGVPAGTHTYVAVYPGDARYTVPLTFGSLTVTVPSPAVSTTALTATPPSSTYGASSTLTATVTSTTAGTPSGSIRFMDGAMSLATIPLSGGSASTMQVLGGGSNSITAIYSGDNTFATSTSQPSVITIAQAIPNVTASTNPSSITLGSGTTLSVQVAPVSNGSTPTGQVSFYEGGTNLGTGPLNTAGTASIPVTPATAGTHTYSAGYGSDYNYASATSMTTSLSVSTAGSAVTLGVSGGGAYGSSTSLSATVASATSGTTVSPTGSVEFLDGSAVLATIPLNGNTAATSVILTGGSHSLSAMYLGDTNFSTSTSVMQPATISTATPAATANASPSTVALGAGTSVSVRLTGVSGGVAPTGTLILKDGSKNVGTGTLSAGTAMIPYTLTAAGNHNLTVVYSGDTNYGTVSSPITAVTVSQGSTTTTLTAPAPVTYPATTTLTATVATTVGGFAPTGSVNFIDLANGSQVLGTASLNGTTASLPMPIQLGGGTHSIQAVYQGDANFTSSPSAAVPVTIALATPAESFSVASGSVAFGGSTTVTLTINYSTAGAVPTGTVTFLVGGKSAGTTTVNTAGQAIGTITFTTGGSNSVTAMYAGDANYAAFTSSATSVFVSTAASTVTLSAPPTGTFGGLYPLLATVSSLAGSAPPTGQVRFMDGVTILATVTLNGNTAATNQILPGGVNNLTAVYLGDTNYSTSTSSTTVTTIATASTTTQLSASAIPVAPGGSTLLTVTIAGAVGGTNPTGTVNFLSGGKSLGAGTLDATGKASFSASFNTSGPNTVTAMYAGDTNYAPSVSSAVTISVSYATTTTLSLSAPTTYTTGSETLTATVATGGSTGGTVTFANAAGVLGTATVNSSGVATLTLTETAAGTQAITASYAASGTSLASVSAPATLTVVPPLTGLAASPASVSLAAGASAPVTLTLTPAGGFTGPVVLSCTSPVAYVTCTLPTTGQSFSGATPLQATAIISVAATVSSLDRTPGNAPRHQPSRGWLALLLPLGALGFAKRSRTWSKGLLLLILAAALAAGITGCGGSSSTTSTPSNLPTAGTQTVTVTAVGGGTTLTTAIAVNITN